MKINNNGFSNVTPILKGDAKNVFDLDVQIQQFRPNNGKNGLTDTCTQTCSPTCVSCTCATSGGGCQTDGCITTSC